MGDLAVKGSKGQEDTLGQCFIEDFLLMPLLERDLNAVSEKAISEDQLWVLTLTSFCTEPSVKVGDPSGSFDLFSVVLQM